MNIGLLGMGTIGSGVFELVSKRQDMRITRVLDKRNIEGAEQLLTQNVDDILNDPDIDVVVELMGGIEPAHEFAIRALKAGKHFVSANKLMIAHNFRELFDTAREHNACIGISASVGGGIPFLHALTRARRVDNITGVGGIVNGTTNLILDVMQSGDAGFADVLKEAQQAGYAEADPAADIDGVDACCKLTIAVNLAYGGIAQPNDILTSGIRQLTREDVAMIKRRGFVCKLLARSSYLGDGRACAYVEPTLLLPQTPEAVVDKNYNLISYEAESAGLQRFYGQGAGKYPTAFAVVQDLIDIANSSTLCPYNVGFERLTIDNAMAAHRYYVRTTARLSINAEKVKSREGVNMYLTEPVTVDRMHAAAQQLRMRDPELFFAGFNDNTP